jgi:hypothetical protein
MPNEIKTYNLVLKDVKAGADKTSKSYRYVGRLFLYEDLVNNPGGIMTVEPSDYFIPLKKVAHWPDFWECLLVQTKPHEDPKEIQF